MKEDTVKTDNRNIDAVVNCSAHQQVQLLDTFFSLKKIFIGKDIKGEGRLAHALSLSLPLHPACSRQTDLRAVNKGLCHMFENHGKCIGLNNLAC